MADEKKPTVKTNKASWKAGYKAGLSGDPQTCPPGVDPLSFWSGVVEGKAAREKGAELPKIVRARKPKPEEAGPYEKERAHG